MPSAIGMMLGGAAKVFGGTARLAVSGTAGRSAIGMGVGGIAGAAGEGNVNSRLEGAAKGMLFGAMGGAAVGFGPKAIGAVARGTPKGIKSLWSGNRGIAGSSIGALARGTGGVGMAALNNPFPVLAGIGVAYGAASLNQALNVNSRQSLKSPTMQGITSNINYNQRTMMAANIGQIGQGMIGTPEDMQQQFAATSARSRLANSTEGLTIGLHQGRHG